MKKPYIRKEIIGDCTLYLGDCMEVMASWQDVRQHFPPVHKIDAVVTDPPYGMNNNTDYTRFSGKNWLRGGGRKHKKIINDDKPFNPAPFLKFNEVILFGCNHFWGSLPAGGCLVWLKRNDSSFGGFLSDAEIAFVKGRSGVFVKRCVFAGSSRACEAHLDPYGPSAHPSQKPIKVMEWCLSFVKGNIILDPFMGSGTTGVACIKMGRSFIGIELDEEYFDIACKRIEDAYKQPDLFIQTEKQPEPQQNAWEWMSTPEANA